MTRVNAYSGLVRDPDGMIRCPYCGRTFSDGVTFCSHCEEPPNALQAAEWQEIPPEPPNDVHRDWSHDSGEDELDREERRQR
jgi:uncharacterized Zn finger protein (UPF0148 family)